MFSKPGRGYHSRPQTADQIFLFDTVWIIGGLESTPSFIFAIIFKIHIYSKLQEASLNRITLKSKNKCNVKSPLLQMSKICLLLLSLQSSDSVSSYHSVDHSPFIWENGTLSGNSVLTGSGIAPLTWECNLL